MAKDIICRGGAALILSLVLLGTLGGCNLQQSPAHGKLVTPLDEEFFNVGVFYYDYGDVYVASVRSELTKRLVGLGVAYHEFDAADSQATQNAQIESAISQGMNCLVVNLVDAGSSGTSDAICLKAERAGIPVIFFNRSIEADGDDGVVLDYYKTVAYVGTDPAEAGHLQGMMIGNYLLAHYDEVDLNQDGKISYTLFKGQAKNAEAIYRTKYAVEDANALLEDGGHPPLQYFMPESIDAFQLDLTGKWSLSAARSYMMTNLASYNVENNKMIELVISNNDNMAEGAILALQAVGFNDPKSGGIPVIPVFGVDATVSARQLIRQGVMTGTVVQDPAQMSACITDLVANASEGKDLLDGMEEYHYDEEHGLHNKFYIPYEPYDPKKEKGKKGVKRSQTSGEELR